VDGNVKRELISDNCAIKKSFTCERASVCCAFEPFSMSHDAITLGFLLLLLLLVQIKDSRLLSLPTHRRPRQLIMFYLHADLPRCLLCGAQSDGKNSLLGSTGLEWPSILRGEGKQQSERSVSANNSRSARLRR
jgi:hypothetical protein